MSTKHERSNEDDTKQPSGKKQNVSGQDSTRKPASSKAARERDGTSDVPRKDANKASKT